MKNKKILFITQGAMIAALYVVLTYAANFLGLASGQIQVRISEALTVLPFFTAAAVPGLFLGCLLANFLTGAPWPDVVFGSMATLIGAFLTYAIGLWARRLSAEKKAGNAPATDESGWSYKRIRWLAPLPPIAVNAVIIPFVLLYAYGVIPLWLSFVTVAIGQIISCGVLGMGLLLALEKRKGIFG